MKNLLLLYCISIGLVSCHVFKKTATTKADTGTALKQQKSSPVFIENISIKNNRPGNNTRTIQANEASPRNISTESVISPEKSTSLQFKYAILLNVPVEEMHNYKLIELLENWYGTPYRMGGTGKTGIDCSAFVQSFIISMYGLSLPRTSKEQYIQTERIPKDELKEGDLVFFRTQRKKNISHVGVYLRNNKFVHASTSSGVMISDLHENYFAERYAGAGRPLESPLEQGSNN